MSIKRIALGTRKGLLLLENNGETWKVRHEGFAGSHVSMVFLDQRTGNLFASLDDGHFGNKLFRWERFLEDSDWHTRVPKDVWQELKAPEYPDGSKLPDGNDAVLKYQWAMSAGSQQQTNRILIGTEPGGLFISDDNGESFELCQPLWDHPSRLAENMPWFGGGRDQAGIHSICIDPRNHDHVRVGISCAGVFLTEDGGASWRPTNRGLKAEFLPTPDAEVGHDPHLLVQCETDPQILWQQNHCGVFVSSDSGESWKDVSQPDGDVGFGFPIAVDPNDGRTAWVVPAESDQVRAAVGRKLAVYRTEDCGETWTQFTRGLPQNECYDFVFRHGLKLKQDELVFGTACGSLYYSKNRGEDWESLNFHFPPIYCVEIL